MTTVIKQLGWTLSENYNSFESAKAEYRVVIPNGAATPAMAIRNAMYATGIPGYLAPLESLQVYATRRDGKLVEQTQGGDAVVDVSVMFEGGQKLENGFLLQARSSMSSETRARDAGGFPLQVTYNDGTETYTQAVETDVMVPSAELVCQGIYETYDPFAIVRQWTGYVNSDTIWGFDPSWLLCTGVSFEAHRLYGSRAYKFQFTFATRSPGWIELPWQSVLLYRDPNTGYPPPDATLGNGITIANVYQGLAYSETAPIGRPTNA